MVAHSDVFEPRVKLAFLDLSREALGAGFGTVVLRAIFAGWLIALMVWLLPAAESSRISVIVIITYVVGLGGFSQTNRFLRTSDCRCGCGNGAEPLLKAVLDLDLSKFNQRLTSRKDDACRSRR